MFIGSVNMITEHTAREGPQGAVDRIILQALNETKKLNIIIKTANFTVLQLWVNIHIIFLLQKLCCLSLHEIKGFWGCGGEWRK